MINAFLLTRSFQETPEGLLLELWFSSEQGPVKVEVHQQEAVAFIRDHDIPKAHQVLKQYANRIGHQSFKNHLGESVKPLYTQSYRTMRDIEQRLQKQHVTLWEADIRPAERFLMERFIKAGAVINPAADSVIDSVTRAAYTHSNTVTSKQSTQANHPVYRNPQLAPSEYRPHLRCVSLDIETSLIDIATLHLSADGITASHPPQGSSHHQLQLYSIGIVADNIQQVFMVDQGIDESADEIANKSIDKNNRNHQAKHPSSAVNILSYPSEKACLIAWLEWVMAYDPDIFMGWNIVQFDFLVLAALCSKHKIPFALGRLGQTANWREDTNNHRWYLTIPGRVALDGIELLKTAFYNFQSFKLNDVANEILGESKLIEQDHRADAITTLFQKNKHALAEYNIQDCQLVWDIFKCKALLEFAIERAQITGLLMDRMGGSVAAFEFAYLPLLHRKGYVAPNLGELTSELTSPGGYVLNSQPGIYQNVVVLDFKSLYPSIIRTFLIDPYSYWYARDQKLTQKNYITGFNSAFFARDEHILPSIVKTLWQARDNAKQSNNQPLSQAIKIIMNAFYGVLGSTGCRFYDPRVCSSITLRGHEILQKSKQWIEDQGHAVIYGDTDSVFVWVGNNKTKADAHLTGQQLAKGLNLWWQQTLKDTFAISSALEIEYETHYLKFLMPTIRNSTAGSKKRYAGITKHKDQEALVFKGLENIRTDWTDLAKEFQYALYAKVFNGESVHDYIREFVSQVQAGTRDSQLVYRKRLRRNLQDYQKNIPPHVQAAYKLGKYEQRTPIKGEWIAYIFTNNGAEPVTTKGVSSGKNDENLQNTAGLAKENISKADNKSAARRAHPIDYERYIQKQLKPVADSILQFIHLNFDEITNQQLGLFE